MYQPERKAASIKSGVRAMFREDFTRTAKKAEGMSDNAFIDAILEERPDLAGKMAYAPEQGVCAHTVFVGDEVFKTARSNDKWTEERSEYFMRGIEREHDILQRLNDRGMPVPELTYEGKSFPFFGMTRLSGQRLTPEGLKEMPVKEKESLAKEIAALCVGISSAISPEEAKNLGVDVPLPGISFTPQSLQEALANPDVRKALGDNAEFFTQKVREYSDMHHERYAGRAPSFMHADLSPGNILYDPQTKKLSGFIDFGVSRVAFPDEGLGVFCMTYPDYFSRMVLKEYSHLQPVQVTREDVRLWECVYAVNRVAEVAREKPEGWEQRMRNYADGMREAIASPPAASSLPRPQAQKTP